MGGVLQYGKGYVPRMHQNPRRVSQTCPKFDRPLEQAFVSNKNDQKTLKTTFLTLVGPHFSFVCVSHGLRKKPPAQVKLQTSGPKQQQSLQHSPDLDPTAPITSNIPPREASREPQHWVECSNMEKDMSQECTKIAEDWHKRAPNLTTHWSKLS